LYVDLKWISREPKHNHHQIINDPAKQSWHLFQIVAPGIAGFGEAAYFESILERAVAGKAS
jgi:hypothetical protein